MFGFGKKKPAPKPALGPFDLDRTLLELPGGDSWRIRDACEGTQIFGMTGSGKTSGSGKAIAQSFLHSGFGGLVLTAKKDEAANWQQWCAEAGRGEDVRIISPSSSNTINFLDYECRRPGAGAGLTHNVVNIFLTILEAGSRQKSGAENPYWKQATGQMLRNAIDLLTMAKGELTLSDIHEVILTAPRSTEELHSEQWQDASFCMDCIADAQAKELDSVKAKDLDLTCRYWLNEYPSLAEKTRSIIVSTFTSMADYFLHSPFREMFCTKTTIVPDVSYTGAIIIVDLPVKEFERMGQYAQVMFKYIWQRAMERRDVKEYPRPVFLWADEAQFFVTANDTKFQSTARSTKAATVYLTQNIPSYLEELGGEQSKATVNSLLGNLGTKIFHANGDTETNSYASELIGKSLQSRASFNVNLEEASQSAGGSQVIDHDIQPQVFTTLAKGGADNDLFVEGVMFQGGRVWRKNKKTYLIVNFDQRES